MGAIADIECLGVVLHLIPFKYIVIVYSAIKSGPVILRGTLFRNPSQLLQKTHDGYFLKSIAT
jgi:hypothetical protein